MELCWDIFCVEYILSWPCGQNHYYYYYYCSHSSRVFPAPALTTLFWPFLVVKLEIHGTRLKARYNWNDSEFRTFDILDVCSDCFVKHNDFHHKETRNLNTKIMRPENNMRPIHLTRLAPTLTQVSLFLPATCISFNSNVSPIQTNKAYYADNIQWTLGPVFW